MKTKDEIIKVIEDLFELFDKNDIVRNTDKDFDFKFFTEQGLRISNVLSKLENIKSELASLREKDEGEPELRITNKEIERRFPIDVSMIRPCNLSTRNKWIQQGIMWYQHNKGK
jgi:hypothetical protein